MSIQVHQAEPVTPRVREQVARIHEESASAAYAHIFTGPFPREETRQRWAAHPGPVGLAVRGDEVLGFVAWHGDELDALYLLPSAAGLGLGGRLLALAEGTRRLWVLADNHHARGFYERQGWGASGRRRAQYGQVQELEYVRPAP